MKTTQGPRLSFVRNDPEQRVDVRIDGAPFTAYRYADSIMKPVLYPVFTSGGHRVTRGFPMERVPGERVDHPHHVGIWLNYGDVNGVDFWNHSSASPAERRPLCGTIRHREFLDMRADGPTARLTAAADWLTAGGAVLLEEKTTWRFAARAADRILDRTTTLSATGGDVRFPDNKEGMIAIRVTRALEQPTTTPECSSDASGLPSDVPVLNNTGVSGRYYSSEGLEGDEVWGTRARWVTLAGRVEGEEVAIIFVDHPDNPGFPTYWHARGYGLFAANPLGQAVFSGGRETMNFVLRQGTSVVFRHRFVIHSGPRPGNDVIRSRYAAFGTDGDGL